MSPSTSCCREPLRPIVCAPISRPMRKSAASASNRRRPNGSAPFLRGASVRPRNLARPAHSFAPRTRATLRDRTFSSTAVRSRARFKESGENRWKPRSPHRTLIRRISVVEKAREPQSRDTKLPVDDWQHVEIVGVIEHAILGKPMPDGFGCPVGFRCPSRRVAAIDPVFMRFPAFEPPLLQTIDIGTPVPDRRLDEVRVPGRMKIAGERLWLAFSRAFQSPHRDLHGDRVAADLLRDRVQGLMNVADEMHRQLQRFLLAPRVRSATKVMFQAIQFRNDTVALIARLALAGRIVTRLVDRNVYEVPLLGVRTLLAQ